MYCPLNWPTFLRLAQLVNGFYANFRAFSRLFFYGKRTSRRGGEGANGGLPEAGVGQNTEGQTGPQILLAGRQTFFLKPADKSTSVSSSQLLYIRLSHRSLCDGFIHMRAPQLIKQGSLRQRTPLGCD